MKKVVLLFGILSISIFSFISCSSDDNNDSPGNVAITPESLPSTAKNFISSYFGGNSVESTVQSPTPNINNSIYTILLNTQLEIDFDRDGNWTEIESRHNQPIPDNFLTGEVPKIYDYVKTTYSSNWIVSIEKEPYGYSIELNNDIDLIFNSNQDFVTVDLDREDNESIVSYTALPQLAQEYLRTNFPNAQYVLVKKKIERNQTFYKVYLSTGPTVEFNSSGNVVDIDYN